MQGRTTCNYLPALAPEESSRVLQKYKMYREDAGTFESAMTLDLAQRGQQWWGVRRAPLRR